MRRNNSVTIASIELGRSAGSVRRSLMIGKTDCKNDAAAATWLWQQCWGRHRHQAFGGLKAAVMAGVGFMIVGSPTSTSTPSDQTPMCNPMIAPMSGVEGRTWSGA